MIIPRPRKLRRLLLGTLAGLLLAGVGLVVHDTAFTRLHQVDFVSEKVSPDRGLRVLQITDFHSLARTAQVDQVIRLAERAEPDVVAITGDLVTTTDADYGQVERLFAGLARTHRNIFLVWGNHDHWNATHTGTTRLHELVVQYGIVLLNNTSLPLDGPWGSLEVIGTDDYFSSDGDLAAGLTGTRPAAFRLVLTHSPEAIPDLRGSAVDLAICGHTHGGQLRLPGIGAITVPGQGWWPQYDKGWFHLDDPAGGPSVPLHIDSGVGTTGPPIRVFNQSQLTLYQVTAS